MQLTSLRKRMHVASELFFFYVELWAENTILQHLHTPLAISKIIFSEKIYKTKTLPRVFWELRPRPILAVLRLLLQKLFWSSSFWDIYCDIYLPQRTKV